MAFCENCGAKLEEDAKFCDSCGNPVSGTPVESKAPASDSATGKPCLRCGAALEPDAVFCPECAYPVKKIAEKVEKKPPVKETRPPVTEPKPPVEEKKSESENTGKIAGAVMAVVLLLLIGVGAYFLFFNGGTSMETPADVIEQFVKEQCDYYDPDDYFMSIESDHNFNDDSNIDTVLVTVIGESTYGTYKTTSEARFQYDKGSENWSLSSFEKWSTREYTVNENVKGKTWEIEDGQYIFTVVDVSGDQITYELEMNKKVYGGLTTGSVVCHATCKGTATLKKNYLEIDVPLPEGFKFRESFAQSGNSTSTAQISVYFGIDDGFDSVLPAGDIYFQNLK